MRYVDPFIGTAHDGNTWPGATRPFGMNRVEPDQYDRRPDQHRRRQRLLVQRHQAARLQPDPRQRGRLQPGRLRVTCRSCRTPDGRQLADGGQHRRQVRLHLLARQRVRRPGPVHGDPGQRRPYRPWRSAPGAGVGDFTFPAGTEANLLFRTSNSLNGSENAETTIDPATRTVSGSVLTGAFCGRRGNGGGANNPDRRSYYRLYFSAVFDQDFTRTGTWQNGAGHPGRHDGDRGEGYLTGADRAGKGLRRLGRLRAPPTSTCGSGSRT